MTNFTNEQLEAWAGLEPIESKEYDGDSWWLYWSIVDQRGYTICDFHAHGEDFVSAFTAAPTLAAALLAERKAREVEVGELRAVRDAAERLANFDTFQPIPLQEIKDQFKAAMMDLVKAMKGQANEAL